MRIYGEQQQQKKEKKAFSKVLLIQESFLIWAITISYIVLAFLCVLFQFDAQLPWLSVVPGVAWGAYAVSQAYYYRKSLGENTKNGIIYETAMLEATEEFRDEISHGQQ